MLARTARVPALWGELPDAASGIVACFDGPYTAIGGRRPGTYDESRIRLGDIDTSSWEPHHFAEPEGELMERGRGPKPDKNVFADPYLDATAAPRLGLLMLRDAEVEPRTPESVQAEALTEAVLTTARDAGVRVMEVRAGTGEPVAPPPHVPF